MLRVESRVYEWDEEKNKRLQRERGVSFETIIAAIESGGLLDIVVNKKPREHQRLYVVCIGEEVYVVPTVSNERAVFMKTIYPSRRMRKKYEQPNE